MCRTGKETSLHNCVHKKEHGCLLLGGSRLILNCIAEHWGEATDGALLEHPNICTKSFGVCSSSCREGGSGDIRTQCPSTGTALFAPGPALITAVGVSRVWQWHCLSTAQGKELETILFPGWLWQRTWGGSAGLCHPRPRPTDPLLSVCECTAPENSLFPGKTHWETASWDPEGCFVFFFPPVFLCCKMGCDTFGSFFFSPFFFLSSFGNFFFFVDKELKEREISP